jgi:hypothetical protein
MARDDQAAVFDDDAGFAQGGVGMLSDDGQQGVLRGAGLRSTRFRISPWCSPTTAVCGAQVKSRTAAECQ